jgi:hypothetical protein
MLYEQTAPESATNARICRRLCAPPGGDFADVSEFGWLTLDVRRELVTPTAQPYAPFRHQDAEGEPMTWLRCIPAAIYGDGFPHAVLRVFVVISATLIAYGLLHAAWIALTR